MEEDNADLNKLRQLIQEGIDSGEALPAEMVFSELRERYSRMVEKEITTPQRILHPPS